MKKSFRKNITIDIITKSNTLKALSIAALAGSAFSGVNPAYADDLTPGLQTPTLKENSAYEILTPEQTPDNGFPLTTINKYTVRYTNSKTNEELSIPNGIAGLDYNVESIEHNFNLVNKPLDSIIRNGHLKWTKSVDDPSGNNTQAIPYRGSFYVELAEATPIYYSYEYDIPDGYTWFNGRKDNWSNNENVSNKIFGYENRINGKGGAIYHDPYWDGSDNISITADFIRKEASEDGGAIYNQAGTIVDLKGTFINNFTPKSGGAIGNASNINSLSGDFVNNIAEELGGAIFNNGGTITNLKGSFFDNYSVVSGGAIFNVGKIENISADFIANISAGSEAGAISNKGQWGRDSEIGSITGDFIDNYAQRYGGAIYNSGAEGRKATINSITGDFVFNYTSQDDAFGGAIYNKAEVNSVAKIGTIKGDFINNYSSGAGGAIYNHSSPAYDNHEAGIASIDSISGDFISNLAKNGDGGAIYNENAAIDKIFNSNFVGNRASGKGGAIYNKGNNTINIVSDNHTTIFEGNKAGEESNAIYLDSSAVSFTMNNGGAVYMADTIKGTENSSINITGSGSELFVLNNDVKGDENTALNVNLSNATLYMANRENVLDGNNLSLNSGTVNMLNNGVGVSALNSLNLKGVTNFVGNVNLDAEVMDRFTTNENVQYENGAALNVIALVTSTDTQKESVAIPFAEKGLQNIVTSKVDKLYAPIYVYDVDYVVKDDDIGYFVFGPQKGSSGGGNTPTYNPAVLTAPVSAVAATQTTVNEAFKYVFEHADSFSLLPKADRLAKLNSNKYAISTDFNNNLGSNYPVDNKAPWVRPFSTFENINMKHGPKVDAITYGTMIGYDGDLKEASNGWYRVGTSHIGYVGSHLSYSGNDTNMNGGLFGATETFYKGNFWSALTATAGATVGQTTTMYGKEDYTSLLAGLASKSGYNFEFKEGKVILQPIMFMSYTFVNTFDYTNAANVRIDNKASHSIQLNPSVRLIGNLKKGWQPYAQVGMVWNLMNKTNVTANGISLPSMSIKPYVEYGVGLQRNWADNFTAFGQAMMRHGGRNGISLTAGFRWAIGKDKIKDVNKNDKKIVKSLTKNTICASK